MSRTRLLLLSMCLVTLTTGCCGFRRCCGSPCGNPCGNACGVGGGGMSPYGGYPAYGGGQPIGYMDGGHYMGAAMPQPAFETAATGGPVFDGNFAATQPQPALAPVPMNGPVAPIAPNYGDIQQAGYAEQVPANTAFFKPESLPTYE